MRNNNFYFLFLIGIFLVSCKSETPSKSEPETVITIVKSDSVSSGIEVIDNLAPVDTLKADTVFNIIETTNPEVPEDYPVIDAEIIVVDTAQIIHIEEIEQIPIIEEIIIEKASHSEWNSMLSKHLSSNGDANYKAFKKDIEILKDYLFHLSIVTPNNDWSKNEKLAYWINLYNASTVELILNNYPVSSITDINNGKPWDLKFIKSGDKTYSLNQIENEIIRPRFNEPRIHMAVNCAAVSCPKLMNSAFTSDKLNSQLSKQAKEFVNNSEKNTLTSTSVHISKIFEWYKEDFNNGNVLSFIAKFSDIEFNSETVVFYQEYNWNLNEK